VLSYKFCGQHDGAQPGCRHETLGQFHEEPAPQLAATGSVSARKATNQTADSRSLPILFCFPDLGILDKDKCEILSRRSSPELNRETYTLQLQTASDISTIFNSKFVPVFNSRSSKLLLSSVRTVSDFRSIVRYRRLLAY
jgi:hypothetical protein